MATELKDYVKCVPADHGFVADCALEAKDLVEEYLTDNACPGKTIPPSIKARAILEVGADLFYRRTARNGVAGLDSPDGGAVRIARDPMKAAYDTLAPYVMPALS